jgi:hypothetical protein
VTAREKAKQLAQQFRLTPEEMLRFLDTAAGLEGATVDALDERMRKNVEEAQRAPTSQLAPALSLLITHLREGKLAGLRPPTERVDDSPHASTKALIAELTAAGDADTAARLQAGLNEVLAAEKEEQP